MNTRMVGRLIDVEITGQRSAFRQPASSADFRAAMSALALIYSALPPTGDILGTMDGALGMLLSRVLGVPIAQGAELIGKLPNSAKLEKVRKVLRNAPGGADAALLVKRYKESYERHSFPRNRIAHSKCVGVWTVNQEFIVFAAFEKVEDNVLAFDAIPIQDMQRATRWGQAMTTLALKVADLP